MLCSQLQPTYKSKYSLSKYIKEQTNKYINNYLKYLNYTNMHAFYKNKNNENNENNNNNRNENINSAYFILPFVSIVSFIIGYNFNKVKV